MALTVDKKFEIVKRNTQEILTDDDLRKLLSTKNSPCSYHGTAPTGPYHLGYLIPLSKLFDFTKAGIKNKVLLANVHAALDDLKAPWEKTDEIAKYYKKCIELSFPWEDKPEFVFGTEFELTKEYQTDLLKLSTLTTVSRATRAASEVTRMKNPKVSELIYPIMQALDEEYLKVDIQLGGIDQRHIFAYAREYLPIIKYKQRVEIMTPLIVSLKGPGVKMSASIPESSIKVYESEESIKNKIKNSYCPVGDSKDNPVLQLIQHIVFPVNESLKIERDKKFGGDLIFKNYKELEKEFTDKKLHPMDLKNSLAKELIEIFKKPRKYFDGKQDMLKSMGPNF